jgi:dynein heavy chain, axonemal
MDERHWWIATKIEQTFSIDKTTSTDATFIESFFRRVDVLDKINSFLFAKGSNKLFFYTTRDRLPAKEITCCHNIVDEYTLMNEPLDNIILLYFIRSDTSSDATISPVSDIYCGEIKHSTQMTALLYSQTLLPLFKREVSVNVNDNQQKAATKATIVTQMEKQIEGISTMCHALQKDKNLVSDGRFEHRCSSSTTTVTLMSNTRTHDTRSVVILLLVEPIVSHDCQYVIDRQLSLDLNVFVA